MAGLYSRWWLPLPVWSLPVSMPILWVSSRKLIMLARDMVSGLSFWLTFCHVSLLFSPCGFSWSTLRVVSYHV